MPVTAICSEIVQQAELRSTNRFIITLKFRKLSELKKLYGEMLSLLLLDNESSQETQSIITQSLCSIQATIKPDGQFSAKTHSQDLETQDKGIRELQKILQVG